MMFSVAVENCHNTYKQLISSRVFKLCNGQIIFLAFCWYQSLSSCSIVHRIPSDLFLNISRFAWILQCLHAAAGRIWQIVFNFSRRCVQCMTKLLSRRQPSSQDCKAEMMKLIAFEIRHVYIRLPADLIYTYAKFPLDKRVIQSVWVCIE